MRGGRPGGLQQLAGGPGCWQRQRRRSPPAPAFWALSQGMVGRSGAEPAKGHQPGPIATLGCWRRQRRCIQNGPSQASLAQRPAGLAGGLTASYQAFPAGGATQRMPPGVAWGLAAERAVPTQVRQAAEACWCLLVEQLGRGCRRSIAALPALHRGRLASPACLPAGLHPAATSDATGSA